MPRLLKLSVIVLGGVLVGASAFGLSGMGDELAEAAPPAVAVATTTTTSTPPTTTTTVPPITTTTVPEKGHLVIHGTGDVAVDPDYIPALAVNGWDHAWSGLDGLFVEDDLTVINLECVPSDIGSPLDKAFVFRCPNETLPSMKANGVDVANLGNN
ncbi:MAG TPA: CapA family protein, partial [Acidimicrobiia bacterium]